MSTTWQSKDMPPGMPTGPLGWIIGVVRGVLLVPLVFGGLLILLALRLVERPFFGATRPITPWLTQFVCRASLWILGVAYSKRGTPLAGAGAMVANHSSWLDIFALNAATRLYFVSKSEVAAWPGIGWLARATGTVFVKRDRKEAARQVQVFRGRLQAGHKLLFFPEGTSTDGLQVLPFKPTLFAAFFAEDFDDMHLQAVTVNYHAPKGQDARFYGWWGNMDFGPHLWSTLAAFKQGTIEVIYHTPVKRNAFSDRKALAKALEKQVRSGMKINS